MELEPDQETSQFRCCIICLTDERVIHVENRVRDDVAEIYNVLVQEELNQLGPTTLGFCDACTETLLKIGEFKKLCLNSIDYLRSQLECNALCVKEEIIDVDEEETYFEETPYNLETHFDETLTGEVDNAYSECHFDESLLPEKVIFAEEGKKESGLRKPKKRKPKHKLFSVRKNQRKIKEENVLKPILKPYDHTIHNNKVEKFVKAFSCNACGCSYTTKTSLKLHIRNMHGCASMCKYCCKIFFDQTEYAEHLQEEFKTRQRQVEIKELYCQYCDYQTIWRYALSAHVQRYHTPDDQKLTCDLCGKSYKLKYELTQHFVGHHMEKRYQCSSCKKKFAYAASLRKHIQGRRNTCSDKQKIYKRSYHKCKDCGLSFSTNATLNLHKRTKH